MTGCIVRFVIDGLGTVEVPGPLTPEQVATYLTGFKNLQHPETRAAFQPMGPVPDLLRCVTPKVGSIWAWEPLERAHETVTVRTVSWNGETVWIETTNPDGRRCWNELSRWVEATVMILPAR